MSEEQAHGLGHFWNELRRRRVIRVIVLYAIAGWVVIEVSSTVLPNLDLPDWSVKLVTVLVGLQGAAAPVPGPIGLLEFGERVGAEGQCARVVGVQVHMPLGTVDGAARRFHHRNLGEHLVEIGDERVGDHVDDVRSGIGGALDRL